MNQPTRHHIRDAAPGWSADASENQQIEQIYAAWENRDSGAYHVAMSVYYPGISINPLLALSEKFVLACNSSALIEDPQQRISLASQYEALSKDLPNAQRSAFKQNQNVESVNYLLTFDPTCENIKNFEVVPGKAQLIEPIQFNAIDGWLQQRGKANTVPERPSADFRLIGETTRDYLQNNGAKINSETSPGSRGVIQRLTNLVSSELARYAFKNNNTDLLVRHQKPEQEVKSYIGQGKEKILPSSVNLVRALDKNIEECCAPASAALRKPVDLINMALLFGDLHEVPSEYLHAVAAFGMHKLSWELHPRTGS